MRRLLPFALVVLAACSGGLDHDAPFDPDAPLEKQAKGEVSGIVALAGEADAAGVNVQLQNDARTYDADTGADGAFRLTGVVPGTYQLRIGTRYFEEETGTLTITLGETINLGTRTLALRRADVTGSATVEALVDGVTESSGGSVLTLTKTASVRSAGEAPFTLEGFRAYAAVVTQTYSTTANGEGGFRFDDVEAGVYELLVETPGASTVTVGNVKVTGEDGDVAVAPVAVQKVSGTFTIDATLADGITASNVYSGSTSVGLTFTQLAAATIELGESADGSAAGCTGWASIPVAASTTRTLGGEGRRYVCARFGDAAGNRSATVVKSIFVDANAPTGSVAINGGAVFATTGTGTLAIAASDLGSGIAAMRIGQAAGTACPVLGAAEAYTSTRTLALGADGDTVTVCVVLGDAAGNWMASPVSDTIVVDTVAPTATAVSINAGAAYATSELVTLTLSAAGATQMRIANGTTTGGAAWEPYRASAAWSLPAGIGSKTVTVDYRDEAGNVSAAAADTIELDNEAPASPSLSVTNAAAGGFVNTATAQLGLFATGAAKMQLSRDGFFDTEPLLDYATAATAYLAGADGAKAIYARFIDAAGNASAVATANVVLDTVAPTGTISLNEAAAYATVAGAGNLTLAAVDGGSGVDQVKVAELGAAPDCDAALASVAPEAYTSTRSHTVAAADGVTLTVCALFGDAAGNWMAAPVSDSIVVDTVAPTSPSVDIDGGATYATSQFVTLALNAVGAAEMRIANGSSPASAAWEPFRASVAWFLPNTVGLKEVSVQFRDAAGNTSLTAADTITLDNEAPASPSLTVTNANAAGYVTSATAQLSLFAVGATDMQLSRDGFFDIEPLETYAAAATMYLSGGDGVKLLYVRFLDAAGNASAIAAASVVLDTQLPETGFMRIDNGAAWTTDTDVELSFTATGADEVAIGQGACPSTGWQAYATQFAHTLTGPDLPAITLYARFRDAAGNTTACISDAIGLDQVLQAPLFAAAVTGEEGVPSKTAKLHAWVTLSGLTADVYEMQVDDDSAFGGAAWRPVTSQFVVPLTKGDGTKTAYVRIRDRAGNTSAASSPWIELDQTGPEAPSLVVTDHSGDGYAVTENQVELVWSKPTDAFAYSLERFVLGVDGYFDVVAALPDGAPKYTDDVTATVGRTHLYRMRALDDLGNLSSYSVAVEAYPFAPLRRVFKVNTSQGLRYFFKPNQGTASLRPIYNYFKVDNDLVSTSLVANTIEWIRPMPADDVFEEALTLRAANQDGSLVYDTVVPLELNDREKLTFDNRGWQQRMAVDVTGVAHVLVSNFNGLNYATNASGSWEYTLWPHWENGWTNLDRHASIAVDGTGNPHVAYYGTQQPRYRTRVNGTWNDELIDAATNTGTHTDIALDRTGIPSAVYFDETKGDLKFARRAGSWVTQAVDTTGTVGQFARIALDAAGKAHVVYYDQSNDALKYATNKFGAWANTTLAVPMGGWSQNWYGWSNGAAGIVVGRDDQPRIAYTQGASVIVTTYDTMLGWQSEIVVPVIQASFASIAIDRAGNPAVAYFDETTYDLHLARKLGGVWSFKPVHTAADPGRYVSIASDGFGDLHLAYGDDGAMAGYMRLVEPRMPAVIDTTGDSGFGGGAAAGPRDALYMADWNRTSNQLVFRTNKNGPWETEVVTTTVNAVWDMNRVRLAVRSGGQVHLIYKDPDVDGLRFWRRAINGTWTTGFIDSGAQVGEYPMLAMAADGTLWATYRAYNGSEYEVRYATRVGAGAWSAPQVLDSNPWNDYVNPIAFKPDGTVVIYSQHIGNWWEKGPLASGFTLNTSDYNNLADGDFVFDGAGKLHGAARDPGADKLIYSTNKSGAWTSEVVSQSGLPTTDTRIRLDAEGFAHIVYYDIEYQAVRYATNATGSWVVVTLDAGPKVGRFLSAFVDTRNHAHVFYYDEINGALKNLYDFAGWLQPSSVSLSTQF